MSCMNALVPLRVLCSMLTRFWLVEPTIHVVSSRSRARFYSSMAMARMEWGAMVGCGTPRTQII